MSQAQIIAKTIATTTKKSDELIAKLASLESQRAELATQVDEVTQEMKKCAAEQDFAGAINIQNNLAGVRGKMNKIAGEIASKSAEMEQYSSDLVQAQIQHIAALVQEYGLTSEQLKSNSVLQNLLAEKKPKVVAESTESAMHVLSGRKVAVKYRDIANPANEWSGRGLAPRWMVAAMQNGATKEDFRV